jgi:GT2 family glycosyltransferase
MQGLQILDNRAIVQPLSNGDNGTRFIANLEVENEHGEKFQLPIKSTLEQVRPFERAIKDKFSGGPLLIPQNWLSFFCIMLSKACWDEIGELDQRLDSRHNDQDYCLRAAEKDIPPTLNIGAFAFHFGDRTLPKVTTEADLNECTRVFQEKWTKRMEKIA